MINEEFLASCTEEQIEKGVAWCIVSNANISMKLISEKYSFSASFLRSKCNKILTNHNLYCTNPNYIMPIAIANDIEFVRRKGIGDRREFIASKNLINSVNKNPYRAICEVYILMSVNK
jgi:hypothetical protein